MMYQQPLKLLAVLAHPDDESFGFGGTFAKYGAEGVDTFVLTATAGQIGWFGAPADNPGPTELGRIRAGELHAATEILGVTETRLLDYMDGSLSDVEGERAIKDIVTYIREVRPQVVVTFDPFGAYGHPDHVAIAQLTAAAIQLAASDRYVDHFDQLPFQVQKFYYRTFDPDVFVTYQMAMGELVMNIDGVERRPVAWPSWSSGTTLNTEAYWEQTWRAVSAHRTQLPGYASLARLPQHIQRELWGKQTYFRVFDLTHQPLNQPETDLFAGMREAAPIF